MEIVRCSIFNPCCSASLLYCISRKKGMSTTSGSPTFNNTIVESCLVHEHDGMFSDEDPSFEVIPRPDTPITQTTNLEGSGLLNINFTVVESLSQQSLLVPNFHSSGSSLAESLRGNYEPVPGSYEVAEPIPDEDNTSLLTDPDSTKHSDSPQMTSLLRGTHELLNSIRNFANSTNDVSVSQLLADVDALVETNKRLHDDLRKADKKTQDAEATAKELFAAQERIKELEQKVQELTSGSQAVANEKDAEKNSTLYDLIQSLWSLSISVAQEVCLQAIPEYNMDANIRGQLRRAQLSATKAHLAIQNTSNSAESILRQTGALESKRRQNQKSLAAPELVAEPSQVPRTTRNEAKAITEGHQAAIEHGPRNTQQAVDQSYSSKPHGNAEALEIANTPQSSSTASAPAQSYVVIESSAVEPSPVKTAVSESSMTREIARTTKSPVDSLWEFATIQQQGSENVGVGIYIRPNARLSMLDSTSTMDAPVRSEYPASLEAVGETKQLVPKVSERDLK